MPALGHLPPPRPGVSDAHRPRGERRFEWPSTAAGRAVLGTVSAAVSSVNKCPSRHQQQMSDRRQTWPSRRRPARPGPPRSTQVHPSPSPSYSANPLPAASPRTVRLSLQGQHLLPSNRRSPSASRACARAHPEQVSGPCCAVHLALHPSPGSNPSPGRSPPDTLPAHHQTGKRTTFPHGLCGANAERRRNAINEPRLRTVRGAFSNRPLCLCAPPLQRRP